MMTQQTKQPLITILGPTASGKTRLAVAMARQFHGEIISADSRQVYQYMDIGTGKDLEEYGDIPYHLIDVIHPDNEYNLFNFARDFGDAFKHITARRQLPFLVGGTGMYLDAVLSRYNLTIANIDENTRQDLEKKSIDALVDILRDLKPALHNTTDTQDKARLIKAIEIAISERQEKHKENEQATLAWPSFEPLILGIRVERELLKKRIKSRLMSRLEAGMIDEVEQLVRKGVSFERLQNFGLEYRYISLYLNKQLNFNDMLQKLNSEIVRFSKQQEKWFRNIEKKQHQIKWLDANDHLTENANSAIQQFLEGK